MDIYSLSRKFWDWAFENPDLIKPNHSALYFFAIDQCNRLGWKQKFGLPSLNAMEAIGIRSHNTYIKTLNELVEFGFITMIERSKNQFSSNIVALSKFDKALDKALDRALIKHASKQLQSTHQSIDSIDIPINKSTNIPINKSTSLQRESDFEFFWNCYNKKIDKANCEKAWNKLSNNDIDLISSTIEDYVNANSDIQFRKHPLTYFNRKCWNDEIIINLPKQNFNNNNYGNPTEKLGTSAARMEALRKW